MQLSRERGGAIPAWVSEAGGFWRPQLGRHTQDTATGQGQGQALLSC